MKKFWVAAPAIIAAPLVLAVCVSAASTPAPALPLSHNSAATGKFKAPRSVTVSSVTPTWATVRFVIPAADRAANREQVVVFPASSRSARTAFTASSAGAPVTITGLAPSTGYYAEVSVDGIGAHAPSAWKLSSKFTTPAASVSPTSAGSSTDATPTPTPAATTTPGAVTSTETSSPVTIAIPWPSPFYTPPEVPTDSASSTSAATVTPTSATATPAPWPTSATATATAGPTLTPTPTTSTPAPALTPTGTPTGTPTDTPTPAPSTSASTSAPSSTATVPYAPALSSYNALAQNYSASDIINDGWAQDANDTNEGGGTCPVSNTSYSSALDSVVLTTAGLPGDAGSNTDCAHIRSQFTVPTSGDVVEAMIWLPSLTSATTVNGTNYPAGTLLDWASMWTDGANSTNGAENWPADTEVDAVETQYGTSYVSVHSGSVSAVGGSTGDWTTEPQGWEPVGAVYDTPYAGVPDVQGGWNVVDIEFTSTDANIYFNGALFATVPGSALSHDPAYLNFGISGPNGEDPNYAMWPAGPATEDVQYVKVFS